MDPALPLTGFLVGFLVGLTGMGGGALMTPFLILVVGTRPLVAVGTDLAYGAITKLAGAYLHWRQGTVDMALVKRLATTSVPAGVAAVVTLHLLPEADGTVDRAVRQALGVVLILVAILLLVRLMGVGRLAISTRWRERLQGRGTYATGGIVGFLVGLTSVGSGSLLVPFLVAVFPLTAAQVVGTDVFHAAILVSATALAHAQGGAVDWSLTIALLIGSIPGVALGSWVAPRMPARALRVGLACLLLMTGITLI
jgi:uncharacterized protein